MAHLVENMAYTGETPWHGLGHAIPANRPLDEWIVAAGMDWCINEASVLFDCNALPGSPTLRLPLTREAKGYKVLYRSDSHTPLSVVSQRYQVVQPKAIMEFYRDLTEQFGFEMETAGVLKGGRKLWALAKTGQTTHVKGKDTVNGYVLLATACDGTMATTAQFTSVRVVCNNTLAIATRDNRGAVKVPHSTQFNATEVKQQLGLSVSGWDEFSYQMKALSERKLTSRGVSRFLTTLFDDHTPTLSVKTRDRNMASIIKLYQGHGKGAELSSAHNTAFGLLNAVTQFVDHEQRAHSIDNRLNSAWFGQGAKLKNLAFDNALALVA
ncbi:MAG: DUF932 domain-containing protein [Alteromonadaceae bacterium TMED7]|nr:MAG: DUF932 domain-containing protein [Alteromonadaceae bacterium TMED7]|tara:strand:+ start:12939 stop:13913 length:975 start_codon:yes stop_codon:yes gene_type:complete